MTNVYAPKRLSNAVSPAVVFGSAVVLLVVVGSQFLRSAQGENTKLDLSRAVDTNIDPDKQCDLFDVSIVQAARTDARVSAVAPPAVPAIAARKVKHYDRHIARAARAYQIDAALLRAVISVESRYDPNAVSAGGASGLMQLMPSTAEQYNVSDLFDPAENVRAGAQHLRYLLRLFDNDLALALAAYNAGEGNVIKHGRRIPPYRETKAYVPKVLAYYHKYQQDVIAQAQTRTQAKAI